MLTGYARLLDVAIASFGLSGVMPKMMMLPSAETHVETLRGFAQFGQQGEQPE